MAARKRVKKVTYGEFLAWLEGVESMQPADWTPTHDQWTTIREKLNSVKPDVQVQEVEAKQEAFQPTFAPAQHPNQQSAHVPQSAFAPAPPQQLGPPIPRQASEHEGVPAATTTPVLNADGTPAAPGTEFL